MKQQNHKTGAWERLSSVIQIANMNANAFAKHIGLARGENLYQIKRGHNRISIEVAECVCNHFSWVNKLWLLTGEGEMCQRTAGRIFIPFQGTRRDWFAGIACAGLLAGGRFDKTPQCANNIAEDMEALLNSEIDLSNTRLDDGPIMLASGSYYWFLGMAMFGLLAGRSESTTCQHIKNIADDMYALHSGIGADKPDNQN